MHRRLLGPGAPAVTAVGYGGMHLSIEGRPPEEQALRVLRAALDAGVTLIDTADVYCIDQHDIGHNERLIAQALAGWAGDRASVTVATKGGVVRPAGRWDSDARPEQLRAACERSLRALGVDRLDLYQLHAPDPRVPLADSVGELCAASRGGQAPLDRAVQREPAPDSRGTGHHPDHFGAEPPESVFPGVAGRGCGGVLRGAGDRVPGVQPDGRGPPDENAACTSRAGRRSPGASGCRPTRWCSRGRWRSRPR